MPERSRRRRATRAQQSSPADPDGVTTPQAVSPPAVSFIVRPARLRRRQRTLAFALVATLALPGIPLTLVASTSPAPRASKTADTTASVVTYNPDLTVAPQLTAGVLGELRASAAGPDDLADRVANDPALKRSLLALRRAGTTTKSPAKTAGSADTATPVVNLSGGSVGDIPAIAVTAYQRAAAESAVANPGCHVPWNLIAGIGRVESDHGRYGGSALDDSGVARPSILGPVLSGGGDNAAIADTDGGHYDGDARWDRAVGPMQFIPSTWATSGRDGDGDGVSNPEDMFDAALAAADYLCASGGDLRTTGNAEQAVLSYNHSWDYVLVVLGYSASYAGQDVGAIAATVSANRPAVATKPAVTRPVSAPRKQPTRVTASRPTARPSSRPRTTPRPTPTKPVRTPTPPISTPTAPVKPTQPPTSLPPAPPVGSPSPLPNPNPDTNPFGIS